MLKIARETLSLGSGMVSFFMGTSVRGSRAGRKHSEDCFRPAEECDRVGQAVTGWRLGSDFRYSVASSATVVVGEAGVVSARDASASSCW